MLYLLALQFDMTIVRFIDMVHFTYRCRVFHHFPQTRVLQRKHEDIPIYNNIRDDAMCVVRDRHEIFIRVQRFAAS